MSDIETRLAAVERSARRWRAAACVAGLALAVAVGVGAQRQQEVPAMLEAHGIRIVDEEGKNVFSVVADGAGASLLMRSPKGGTLMINDGDNGPFIGIRSRANKVSARIGAADAGGQIRLYDADGKITFSVPD